MYDVCTFLYIYILYTSIYIYIFGPSRSRTCNGAIDPMQSTVPNLCIVTELTANSNRIACQIHLVNLLLHGKMHAQVGDSGAIAKALAQGSNRSN